MFGDMLNEGVVDPDILKDRRRPHGPNDDSFVARFATSLPTESRIDVRPSFFRRSRRGQALGVQRSRRRPHRGQAEIGRALLAGSDSFQPEPRRFFIGHTTEQVLQDASAELRNHVVVAAGIGARQCAVKDVCVEQPQSEVAVQ